MKANITKVGYSVPLTDSQWQRLRKIEDDADYDIELMVEGTLFEEFPHALRDVEYGGHFGSFFYFALAGDDIGKLAAILTRLEELLK